MTLIRDLQEKVAAGAFEFSKHAIDQSILRRISVEKIVEVLTSGEVIEDYPNDKYGPSCLIAGVTKCVRPIHVQVSYPTRPLVKIITTYEPDPEQWIEFKRRRK